MVGAEKFVPGVKLNTEEAPQNPAAGADVAPSMMLANSSAFYVVNGGPGEPSAKVGGDRAGLAEIARRRRAGRHLQGDIERAGLARRKASAAERKNTGPGQR